jgi:hypothetical protein
MRKVIIICLIAISFMGCKKEAHQNEYIIEVITDDKGVEFKVDAPPISTMYHKAVSGKFKYTFNQEKAPSKLYVSNSNSGLYPGKTIYIYYYKNGELMLTRQFKCEETSVCQFYISESIDF